MAPQLALVYIGEPKEFANLATWSRDQMGLHACLDHPFRLLAKKDGGR